MTPDWRERLFAEKSLWEIYRLSHRVFPRSKFNRVAFWVSVVAAAAIMLIRTFLLRIPYSLEDSSSFISSIAERLFGLSLGILGFLIAGFAIFASITNVKLFILLAQIPYTRDDKDMGISQLQYVFFTFLNVFTFYILVLSACTLVLFVGLQSSPLSEINGEISSSFPLVARLTNCAVATGMLTTVTAGFLELKSFVWNLYQAALLSIVTAKEDP